MKTLAYILLSLTVVQLLSSCDKQRSPEDENYLAQKANRYIDQNEPQKAIELIENSNTSAQTPRVKIILASAYAARSGVKLKDYWNFTFGFDKIINQKLENDQQLTTLFKFSANQFSSSEKKSLNVINKEFREVLKIKARLDEIPLISNQQYQDLFKATEILDQISEKSAKAYRAILHLILFKSRLEFILENVKSTNSVQAFRCGPLAPQIFYEFLNSAQHLYEVVKDMQFFDEANRESLISYQNQLEFSKNTTLNEWSKFRLQQSQKGSCQ